MTDQDQAPERITAGPCSKCGVMLVGANDCPRCGNNWIGTRVVYIRADSPCRVDAATDAAQIEATCGERKLTYRCGHGDGETPCPRGCHAPARSAVLDDAIEKVKSEREHQGCTGTDLRPDSETCPFDAGVNSAMAALEAMKAPAAPKESE